MHSEVTAPERWQWLGAAAKSVRLRTRIFRAAAGPAHLTSVNPAPNLSWRNRRNSWLSDLACILIITLTPALTVVCWISLEYFDGSLLSALREAQKFGITSFFRKYGPSFDAEVGAAYAAWVLFQALLYTVLPGRSTGQLTAAGNLLEYRTNGFLAWLITISAFILASFSGLVDSSVIARSWSGLVAVLNIYGFVLSFVAYFKAYYAPSHVEDRNFSGNEPLCSVSVDQY
jgi:Ergosterol biosynthesis ERG4/ERG24 family